MQITGYLFVFRCLQWKMAGITRSTLIDGPSTILRASKLICVLIMNGLDSHCLTGPKKSVKLFQVENCVILLSTWLNQIALMMKYYIKPVKSILKDKLSSHKNSHNYSSFVGPRLNKSENKVLKSMKEILLWISGHLTMNKAIMNSWQIF